MAPVEEVPQLTRREQFDRDGFLILRNFATAEECAGLQKRMRELIDKWDPKEHLSPVFRTDDTQSKSQGSSDYFLDSADRIHFFLEKDAAGEDGSLKPDIAKRRALNKVGHGLHVADDVFMKYSYSDKVKDLVAELGWRDPVLPQSMYIFKQPGIGGEVTSHQDSCFLHTTPRPSCLGLWLAIDDATLENGCLWARAGSHKEPIRRLFVRNPKYFQDGDRSAPQMTFETLDAQSKAMKWEGKMPQATVDGLKAEGWTPAPMAAGDLFVIHGELDHLSLANTSQKPRDTYQLHLVEGPSEGITWSARNWLQYPAGKTFPSLQKGVESMPSSGSKRKADEL
eukprot:TRINITY_DN18745_c0_g1_i1.p1 TRINITY_DN18745_c0_g1~~TRINITY_DN18745_c0_g1_i1.p1  ORF type:complete len:359 (-),score=63.27 TRINITY_DN18745_c0_g1_i1:69-1085(-)